MAGHLPVPQKSVWGALSNGTIGSFLLRPDAFARSASGQFVAARGGGKSAITSNSQNQHVIMPIGQMLGHNLASHENIFVYQCISCEARRKGIPRDRPRCRFNRYPRHFLARHAGALSGGEPRPQGGADARADASEGAAGFLNRAPDKAGSNCADATYGRRRKVHARLIAAKVARRRTSVRRKAGALSRAG